MDLCATTLTMQTIGAPDPEVARARPRRGQYFPVQNRSVTQRLLHIAPCPVLVVPDRA